MNLETKGITALTREYDNFPLWSPRGDLIMFARLVDGAYEINAIKPDGTD
jgi:Tol biopolymer transport system component